jgi:SEC-C motif-containing protein
MVIAACPCGSSDYASCCGRYHQQLNAPDAASLMRSRYSAYVLKREDYLLETWHLSTRPAALELASDHTKWLGLEVKKHVVESATHAAVEFVAFYKIAGKAHRLHEISLFVFEDNKWFYLDGEFPNA